MKDEIIAAAGRIWQVLGEKEQVNIAQLPKMMKEKTVVIYQALGWLAREDKVQYTSRAGKIYVSLTPAELNAHKLVTIG